jgi:hypothetical protein
MSTACRHSLSNTAKRYSKEHHHHHEHHHQRSEYFSMANKNRYMIIIMAVSYIIRLDDGSGRLQSEWERVFINVNRIFVETCVSRKLGAGNMFICHFSQFRGEFCRKLEITTILSKKSIFGIFFCEFPENIRNIRSEPFK